METSLKCSLLLSLEEMALRTVVACFWNDLDVLSSVGEVGRWRFKDSVEKDGQSIVEDKIKAKIMKLSVPRKIKEWLTPLIRPMGFEVQQWTKSQLYFLETRYAASLPDRAKLCWTSTGTISYKRTAKELIHSNEMSVETCYELACYYCLEDDISLYWEKLSEKQKKKYANCKPKRPLLPYCWPRILEGKQSALDYLWKKSDLNLTSFHQHAFEYYSGVLCKTAAEHFLQELTPEEREVSLRRCVHHLIPRSFLYNRNRQLLLNEERSSVLLFLISAMTPEQQLETVNMYPLEILSLFLDWPMHDLLSENVDLFWSLFPPTKYQDVVLRIANGYRTSGPAFCKSFKTLITKSPQDFRKIFAGDQFYAAGMLLLEFFKYEDTESIKILFRNVDPADRVKIVFLDSVLELFFNFMPEEKCNLVWLCLREAMLSVEEKRRMKETIPRYLERNQKKQKFKLIFIFLDKTIAIADEQKK